MRVPQRSLKKLTDEEWNAERIRKFGVHHPWCNFFMEQHADECTMCNGPSGLNVDHPVRQGDTPDDLMRRYFPDNRRIQ